MTRPFRFCVLIYIAIVLLLAFVGPVSAVSVPQITGISPSGGPITGGTVVTITGSGFSGTTDVRFGETSGTGLSFFNDSRLSVIAPPNPQGTVPLSIINPAETGRSMDPSTMYEYDEFPPPRLSGISSSSGPIAGFTMVTFTGSGFTGTDYVQFGGRYGMNLNIVDDSHLTVMTPPSSPGTVPVSITNAHGIGISQDLSTMYLYEFPQPELTNITPSSGFTTGGTVVTVTGSGFSGATDVQFGRVSATGLSIVNDSQLTIIAPPNSAGPVALYVINPAHTGGSAGSAAIFRYDIPVPRLTGISPSSGSMEGGTVVTLTGSGFTGTTDVRFGGKTATGLHVINDSLLTVITPQSSLGLFPISITNAYGQGGSQGPSTLFRFVISPDTTTTATNTSTPYRGHSSDENISPTVSFPVPSPALTAPPAPAAPGTKKTPGFEAIAGLSALGAIILWRRPTR